MTIFPTKNGMTLRRFVHKLHFICTSCDGSMFSKFRAETPNGVICNRCYGRKLFGAPPVKESDAPAPLVQLPPLVLHGTKTGRISTRTPAPKHVSLRGCTRLHLTPSHCGKEYGCESDS